MTPGVMLFDEVTAVLDLETVKEALITNQDLRHDLHAGQPRDGLRA